MLLFRRMKHYSSGILYRWQIDKAFATLRQTFDDHHLQHTVRLDVKLQLRHIFKKGVHTDKPYQTGNFPTIIKP